MAELKARDLRISFPANSKQPEYAFKGEWTGFEISSVLRGIRRAYLLHNRTKRRAVSESAATKEDANV